MSEAKVDSFPVTLRESLENIIKKEGYITSKVSSRTTSSGGANYMGDLFAVDIKGETANGYKETHLFVKHNVSRTAAEEVFTVSDAHTTEKYFYEDLSKIYAELEEKAKVPLKERFNVVKSYEVLTSDAIFLENMSLQGYKIPDRFEDFSLRFAELSVQQLAKFHGLSFVLQRERSDYYDTKLKEKKYPLRWNDEFILSFHNFVNITNDNVDIACKLITEPCKSVLLEKYGKYMDVLPHKETTVYCLCHGDYRNANILMKEIEGEVTKIIPVDYQTIYHGCPVNDLLYLIYTGSSGKFRKEHMQDLKNMYYDTLSEYLRYFNMSAEEVYPRNEFENVFKERLDYGLILTVMWGPMMFVPKEDAPDLEKIKLYEINFKPDERFGDRVRGTIEEFEEYSYFKKYINK